MPDRTIHILLIEDNPGDARIVREMLKDCADLVLHHVETLSAGIEHLVRQKMDSILLDLNLPDSHGLETLHAILGSGTNASVLVLTGLDDDALGQEAVRHGAQDFLVKNRLSEDILAKLIRYAYIRNLLKEQLRLEKEFTDQAFNAMSDTFFVFEPGMGKAVRWNEAFRHVSGYNDEEIAQLKAPDTYYEAEDLEHAAATTQRILDDGHGKVELALRTKDGRRIPFEYSVAVMRGEDGSSKYFAAVGRDLSERKAAEQAQEQAVQRQTLAAQVLGVLNQPGDEDSLVQDLIHLIRQFTGFDAVGLRLRKMDDYPYYMQNGFADEFVKAENSLCTRHLNGSCVMGEDSRPVLECTCGIILSGRVPAMPCFTERGSFWTNRSSDMLSLAPSDDPRTNPRNRCIQEGYQSVALIPLRSGKEIIGLLQLNDHRENRFSAELIHFFEGLAESIGVALKRHQAKEDCQRIADLYATLSQANQALVRVENESELFREICRVCTEFGKFKLAWIGTVEPGSTRIRIRASAGPAAAFTEGLDANLDANIDPSKPAVNGPCRLSLSEGTVQLRQDWDKDPSLAPCQERARRVHGIRSSVAIPVLREGKPYATLNLYADTPDFFVAERLNLLCEMGEDLGYALNAFLEKARRKEAEGALRASEEKYRQVVELVDEGLSIVDTSEVFQYANPAAGRIFGLEASRLKGRSIREFVDDKTWERIRAETSLREKGVHSTYELEIVLASGLRRILRTTATPIMAPDGTFSATLATLSDITEQWKREETLLLLQTAIDAATEAVIITEADGKIVFVNPVFEKITGYTSAEALGQNPRLLKSDLQAPRVYQDLWLTIRSGKPWQGELTNRRKDGSTYEQRLSIAPIHDPNGAITHFVGIATDITREKNLEAQLIQAVKMEALGRLAGGIAHDFNNLLTIINGYAEMLIKHMQEEGRREDAQEILKAGEKAAKLTSHILAFSRKETQYPRIISVNETLADIQKMIGRIIGEDIHLSLSLYAGLWDIRIDPSHLEQVIMNVAVNARDAMPSGGSLEIETRNFQMDDEYVANHVGTTKGDYVMLSIRDNGTGMPPEVRARIFEPFFTTKGLGRGTGMGLSMVFGIVQQNRGHIQVESEPEKGTTFRFFFPKHQEAQAKPEGDHSARPPLPHFPGKKVLVAEDEDSLRGFAVKILHDAGFTVQEARTGGEAIEFNRNETFDLGLIDLVLPDFFGTETAAEMRKDRPALPILFTSGYPEKLASLVLPGTPHCGVIEKPFTGSSLLEAIERLLAPTEENHG